MSRGAWATSGRAIPRPASTWDVHAAVLAGLCAAGPPGGPARHAFIAELAFRLARLGPFVTLDVRIADHEAASEAALSVLAEMAAGAQQPTPEPPAPYPPAANASSKRTGALARRTRACLNCGAVFEVNFRHADKHRFCSAACRSRHRRAQAKSTARSLEPWSND